LTLMGKLTSLRKKSARGKSTHHTNVGDKWESLLSRNKCGPLIWCWEKTSVVQERRAKKREACKRWQVVGTNPPYAESKKGDGNYENVGKKKKSGKKVRFKRGQGVKPKTESKIWGESPKTQGCSKDASRQKKGGHSY